MAGLGANFEYDLKRILINFDLELELFLLVFVGVAFFHLLTRALFKALLFMCSGIIIHVMGDSQDIRFMGSTRIVAHFKLCVPNFEKCFITELCPSNST
jgi:NADH:ubiquinone oxidoreductase subunit 5 (subunit L)/multisubunit Na+/H+ antiporter MnhA subunit